MGEENGTSDKEVTETIRVVEVDRNRTSGVAIVSLVFGIMGFLLWLIPFVGWLMFPLWITAIITGFVGKKNPSDKGMCIAGIVLGAIPIVMGFLLLVGWFFLILIGGW